MAAPASDPPPVPGRATPEGTARYAARHAVERGQAFYRPLAGGLTAGSLGIGTSRGDPDDATDAAYAATLLEAFMRGINLADAAINYRCQRSERVLGGVLRRLGEVGVGRDEVVVCTKGGFVPGDGAPAAEQAEWIAYLRRNWLEPGIFTGRDVVPQPAMHVLTPAFVADQLARSRANLGVATIDVYYLHNPELQRPALGPDGFRARIGELFALLEARCAAGEIGVYGCATWSGFRVPPDDPGHLSLAELAAVAREAGGEGHHFRVAQVPLSPDRREAAELPLQRLDDGRETTLLAAAAELGISVITSGTLSQGALAAQAAESIAWVRALPGVACALVGMKTPANLHANLAASG